MYKFFAAPLHLRDWYIKIEKMGFIISRHRSTAILFKATGVKTKHNAQAVEVSSRRQVLF